MLDEIIKASIDSSADIGATLDWGKDVMTGSVSRLYSLTPALV